MGVSLQRKLCSYSTSLRNLFQAGHRSFANNSFEKVSHCIFDMDGTILDSELLYHRMVKQILYQKFGKKYKQDLINKLYGRSDRDVCLKLVEKFNLPVSAEVLEQQIMELSGSWLHHVPFQKGAERLIIHLYKSKVPMALATNSKKECVRLHEESNPKIFNLFHHKVCIDDPEVKHGKPQPDLFLVAASRFDEKPTPKDCLVFEDSLAGVKAANRAGMQVVMIPVLHHRRKDTQRATLVIKSLLEFRPEIFGLPPFNDQIDG